MHEEEPNWGCVLLSIFVILPVFFYVFSAMWGGG